MRCLISILLLFFLGCIQINKDASNLPHDSSQESKLESPFPTSMLIAREVTSKNKDIKRFTFNGHVMTHKEMKDFLSDYMVNANSAYTKFNIVSEKGLEGFELLGLMKQLEQELPVVDIPIILIKLLKKKKKYYTLHIPIKLSEISIHEQPVDLAEPPMPCE